MYDPSSSGVRRYLNDHSLIKSGGRWHLFSIVGRSAPPGTAPDSGAETSFAHASAPTLDGPWTTHPAALTADPGYHGEKHLWAPHVIAVDGVHWMFYAAGGDTGAAINAATSTDLFTWTRVPSGPLFRGIVARDPMVTRIGGAWVMYYTEVSAPDGRHLVSYRRSTDLLNWSSPGTAFTDESTESDGVSVTESPYVLERDSWYYLFIGPRNGYDGTDVLASRDPYHFTLDGYAGHIPGHAVEPVTDGGRWYASAAGWFRKGLHIAPLTWQNTPPPWQSPDNPVAAADVLGRLNVFAFDARDRSMLRRVQLDPETDTWSAWETFGTPAGAVPALGRNADGRLEVFSLARGGTGLLHRWQLSPGGAWSAWARFGTPAGGAPCVVRDGTGRLEVTAIAPSGTGGFQRRQAEPSGGWGEWRHLLGWSAGAPLIVPGADGRLEAFGVDPGGERIAHRWQLTPGGAWAPDGARGEDFDETGVVLAGPPSAAMDATGRIHVFAVTADGRLRTRVQALPGGGWRVAAVDGLRNAHGLDAQAGSARTVIPRTVIPRTVISRTVISALSSRRPGERRLRAAAHGHVAYGARVGTLHPVGTDPDGGAVTGERDCCPPAGRPERASCDAAARPGRVGAFRPRFRHGSRRPAPGRRGGLPCRG
ncbi:glycosyl hydrolase family 32 [Streptomyces sp. NPDC047130]|uniref:glycosyl hydrolase family 32 n=1 Tax=Streptomyces sp. NPDC047130 TaxID=3155261 RepID=UPI0033E308F4